MYVYVCIYIYIYTYVYINQTSEQVRPPPRHRYFLCDVIFQQTYVLYCVIL